MDINAGDRLMFPFIYLLLIAFSDIALPLTAVQVITGKSIKISPNVYIILISLIILCRYFIPVNYLFLDFIIYLVFLFSILQHDYTSVGYQIGFFLTVNIIILPIVNIVYYYLFNGYYNYTFVFANILPHSNLEFICKMLLMMLLLYMQSNKIKKSEEFEKKYWYSLYLFSVLCFLSLILLTGFSETKHQTEFYLFNSALSGIIILLLYIFNVFFKSLYEYVVENHRLIVEREKNKIKLDSMLESQSYVEEIKKFKHDMNNNFIVLKHLINSNKIKEANTYLAKYIKAADHITNDLNIDNTIINAIVNNKIRKYPNIKFNVKCFIPDNLSIDDLDMVTILGNLLDNASEYLERNNLKETVNLKIITYMDSSLFIEIRNLFLDKKFEHDVRYTDKKEKDSHGYGLLNIQKTIEKYQGIYKTKIDKNYFITSIIIPEGGKERNADNQENQMQL